MMSFSLSINQSLSFLVSSIVVVVLSCPSLVYRPGCRVCAIKLVHQSRCAIDATTSLPRDIRMWVVELWSCVSSSYRCFFRSPFLSYWLTNISPFIAQSGPTRHQMQYAEHVCSTSSQSSTLPPPCSCLKREECYEADIGYYIVFLFCCLCWRASWLSWRRLSFGQHSFSLFSL